MVNVGALANFRELSKSGLGVPLVLMMLLAMVVLPLPPILLDLLFTFNIALSLVIILASIYAQRPLEFAVFPTVLLLSTLLRLALNVASTRVVLLHGHTGPDAAGRVIESFGEFVVGGNYTVGLVVFIILVIINFIVVTKGAGRISEVSARFTLDAMPGKQMAIDADLNAGLINQEEAKKRRTEVVQEADFYGAMDGASKFVRGDAIAGILILVINVVGGLAIGMAQHGLAFGEALHNYTLLTIGDGLVAQLPALLLSTAAAIIITRVSTAQDMGQQIVAQLFDDPRTLGITSGILGTIGMIPGMPNMVFLTLAAASGATAHFLSKRKKSGRSLAAAASRSTASVPSPVAGPGREALPGGGAAAPALPGAEQKELSWDDVTPVDAIGLEVGYRLISLVDKAQGGQLMGRIKGVRKKLTQDIGFLIPAVHIRDNLELTPNSYRISIMGVTVGQGDIFPDREMAINPGQVFGKLDGIAGKDPAFGLEAVWINPGQREQAQTLGYTVVDASTVVATHLSHLLQAYAHKLLGREELQQLLDRLARSMPKLVEELPEKVPSAVVLRVLQNLLEENIPIRDMRTIAETLAEHGVRSQDPAVLTAAVRIALGRLIVQKINGLADELPAIVLDPQLEQILQSAIQASGDVSAGLEPGLAETLHKALAAAAQRQEMNGQPAVLLVSAPIRPVIAKFVRHSIPGLTVLSYQEVPDDKQVKVVNSIGR
jgi:flagellar biosynthesis protein FlhA